MPGPNTPQRLAAQIQRIRDAFRDDGIQIHNYPPHADDRDTQFLFRADRLLTSDEFANDVEAALQRAFGAASVEKHNPMRGLVVFTFGNRTSADIVAVVDSLNSNPENVVKVSFDHILHISSASCCPATEPELVPNPGNPPFAPNVTAPSSAGAGVKVSVVDTGVLPGVVGQHTWLSNSPRVDGELEGPLIGHYTGHGTFVAGVLRTFAPKAEVHVHALFGVRGAKSESDLAMELLEALHEDQPHVISMSAGTRTVTGGVLFALNAFHDQLVQTDTLLVCAAGNDGDHGPFAPASLDWTQTVAVGALDETGHLATYSNHNGAGQNWVDVFARGSGVVNAYPNGQYTYVEEPHTPPSVVFANGLAEWSGTSFATPIVSGLIAAELSASPSGTTPEQAWARLKARADANAGSSPSGLPNLP